MSARNLLPSSLITYLRKVRTYWRLRREFTEDFRRYARYAMDGESSSAGLTARQVETQLTKDYHRVEKGLALRSPKRPFGSAVQQRLERLLAVEAIEAEAPFVGYASSARAALLAWNGGGVIDPNISPVAIAADRGIADPDAFFRTRHSVRDFGDREVSMDLVELAAVLATQSPSVCNRQPWRLLTYSDRKEIDRVLALQNGNSGFRESVPVVAVLTVDEGLFASPGERNQAWIEGGIFGATFVWALHSLGLDTCMLNMSITNAQASSVRSELGIPDSDAIIMMIAIGYGNEGHRIARSPRRSLSEVLLQR